MESPPDSEFASFLRCKGANDDTIRKLVTEGCDSVESLQHVEPADIEDLGLSKLQLKIVSRIIKSVKSQKDEAEEKTTHNTSSQGTMKTDILPDTEFVKYLLKKGLKDETIRKLIDAEYESIELLQHMEQEDIKELGLSKPQFRAVSSIVKKAKETDTDYALDDAAASSSNVTDSTSTLGGAYPKTSKQKRDLPSQLNRKNNFGMFQEYLEEMGADSEPLDETYKNGMKVIKVPVKQDFADKGGKVRRCIIGSPKKKHEQKTIMVVGATGAGKSTLIDSLINCVFDTKWTDKHRIRLIDQHADEAENESKGQSQSQTEWITIYTITCGKSTSIPFTLNIIDTPGFGDTRGVTRDQVLVDQIRALFSSVDNHGLDCIDAICFVAKAPDARLTSSQKYIFNSVLSVFGKDIADNIIVMITFADGQPPAVLDAIKAAELPHKQHFSFNNSALFSDDGTTNRFSKNFWDMSVESFKLFFDFLSTLTPKSLTMTQDVLEHRRRLKDTLKYLQDKIQEGLGIMSTVKKEKEIFEKHKKDIEANKDFEIQTTENYQEKEVLARGKYSNYCHTCEHTCHNECTASTSQYFCEIFTWGGNCKRCRGRCSVGEHERVNYRYVSRERATKTTCKEKYRKYQEATGNSDKTLTIIQLNELAYETYQREFEENMQSCADVLKQLDEIALKPDPMSELEYIEELIATEKSEHKDGWEDRVEELRKFKEQAKRVKEIRTRHNLRSK